MSGPLGSRTVAAALAATAADALVAAAWAAGLAPGAACLALHLALAAAPAALGRRRARAGDGHGATGLFLLGASVAAFGPAGGLGVLLAAACHAAFRRSATDFDEWFRTLFPDMNERDEFELAERIRSGREEGSVASGVAPFVDVLRLGTREEKEAVIALLARAFKPAFAPALKLALADPVPSIRVQAATAAAQIDNELLAASMALSAAVAAAPQDAAPRLALARHEEAHADLGLLEPQQEAERREGALALYREALDLAAGDGEARAATRAAARAAIGRCLHRLGRVAEARAALADCLADGIATPDLLGRYLDCLFREGDLEGLREAARRHAHLAAPFRAEPGGATVADCLDLWGAPA